MVFLLDFRCFLLHLVLYLCGLLRALVLRVQQHRLRVRRARYRADLYDCDCVQHADVVRVSVHLLEVVFGRIVADAELLDSSRLDKRLHVLAGSGRKHVGLNPHPLLVHTRASDHADHLADVVLIAEGHPLEVLTREELVARSRRDDVTPAVHVTEGKGIRLDVKDAVLSGLLPLNTGSVCLVLNFVHVSLIFHIHNGLKQK